MDSRDRRGDRSSGRGSSSRGDRFDRGRQNQREGESLQQHTERLSRERTGFLQEAAEWGTITEYKIDAWRKIYVENEEDIRGLKGLKRDNMDTYQKKVFQQIAQDAELVILGKQSMTQDKVEKLTDQWDEFNNIVESLGKQKINVFSDEWTKFRQEAYDNLIEKYKLHQRDVRVIMLADILQVENANKCSSEQRTSREYKAVVRIVVSEWETWQKNNQ